jgi:hypothetical protein
MSGPGISSTQPERVGIMSSARPGQRRAPPSPLTPTVKQVVSVEEWESKAPLDELELKSVAVLKTASEKIPLPLKVRPFLWLSGFTESSFKFTVDGPSPSPSTTPAVRDKPAPGSRPTSPILNTANLPSSFHELHPNQPVQTPQQFYDWFTLIDRSVAHSQEAHFRAHLANISQHLGTCDKLIGRIDEVDKEVESMLEEWRGVEEGGRSLKNACETLLDERVRSTLFLT